jgi:mono/diheme cytochrome c family protein
MDPTRDNSMIRFATFWWGIATFFIFALLLAVIWFFNDSEAPTMEEAASVPRYATKAKIDAAQAANVSQESISAAIVSEAKKLVGSKPAAVEKPEQVVPGSETAKKLASAPAVDTSAMDKAPATDEPVDEKLMEAGKGQYLVCGACHGQNGEGTPIAPPLAGSEWVTGPISNLIKIQLRGLQGPISVAGKEYNQPGGMAPLSYQTDEQIAGVLTYIRNSFGNKASGVKPEQVTALRSEVGKPQVTVEELTKP